MSAPATYVEHYTEGNFAPHVTERQLVCADGVWMLDIVQPAGAFPDPPVPKLVLQRDLRGTRAAIDFGAGRFEIKPSSWSMVLAPPLSSSDIVVHDLHNIRVLALPTAKLDRRTVDEGSAARPTLLSPLHATGSEAV